MSNMSGLFDWNISDSANLAMRVDASSDQGEA
jgi:hypothetical protein